MFHVKRQRFSMCRLRRDIPARFQAQADMLLMVPGNRKQHSSFDFLPAVPRQNPVTGQIRFTSPYFALCAATRWAVLDLRSLAIATPEPESSSEKSTGWARPLGHRDSVSRETLSPMPMPMPGPTTKGTGCRKVATASRQ